MKKQLKKPTRKHTVRGAHSKLKTRLPKSPFIAGVAIVVALLVLGGSSYSVYHYFQASADDNKVLVTQKQGEKKEALPNIDNKLADINKDDVKKASETKKDYSDPRAPTLTTGAGCITCDNNPKHSIITNFKSTKMRAGTTIGPFSARTSTGVKVDWSTPGSPKDFSPYSYIKDTSFFNRSSITFYIRTETNVKPGTYQMQMTAVDTKNYTRARHFANITVTEKGYFTITPGPATIDYNRGYYLNLPLKLNRFNGHDESVSMSAEMQCPGSSKKYFDHSWDHHPSPRLVGPINNFGVPNTCTITMDAVDASHQTVYKKTVTFSVN